MKVKVSKDKLVQMWNALSEIGKGKTKVKFSYAVARNKSIIEPEIKALTEAQKLVPEYQEYDTERLKMCREMAKKDENGAPKMLGVEFDIEDREAFDKKVEKLQKKHKKVIDEQKLRIDQFNELIKEEIEIDFYTIKAEFLPEDIEANYLELMMDFIDGEPGDV